jgi:hypothetical protein
MGTAATLSPPPLGLGRALVLVAASLLLHAFVLSGLRARLIAPSADAERPTRTIEAALIVQAPPAPPAPPRRPAPRRAPRPAPPAAPAHEPVLVPEPPPVVDAAMAEPPRAAPGESDAPIAAAEVAPPVTPAADLALVEPKPAEFDASARGSDLASELSELGGAIEALPTAGSYVYKTRDSRYAALSGTTTIEWHVDAPNQRYESRLRSTVFGIPLADISSAGTIRRFGLAPERYVQKTGTRAPQAANLDWERHVVTFSSRTFQRPAVEGMQDRLSFQFQLMALGQRLPDAFRPGATVSMDVAGPGDVEAYHFLVVGTEIVETEAGPIEAIKLDRPKGDGADTRIEVWLAPSRRYLPVRLRFTDRRDNVTENLLESSNESG